MANDKRYNYSGTVRQSGVCIERLPHYTQSVQYLKYSMYNMYKHKQQGHKSLCKYTATYKQQFIENDSEVCGSALEKLRPSPPGIFIFRMGELSSCVCCCVPESRALSQNFFPIGSFRTETVFFCFRFWVPPQNLQHCFNIFNSAHNHDKVHVDSELVLQIL